MSASKPSQLKANTDPSHVVLPTTERSDPVSEKTTSSGGKPSPDYILLPELGLFDRGSDLKTHFTALMPEYPLCLHLQAELLHFHLC